MSHSELLQFLHSRPLAVYDTSTLVPSTELFSRWVQETGADVAKGLGGCPACVADL